MFSNLATKLALKKVGISSDTFTSKRPSKRTPAADDDDWSWPEWMSVKGLPISVQPWLTPPPPPIPVGKLPQVGELAPLDRDRRIVCGRGGPVLVVFLRCVGCACKSIPSTLPTSLPGYLLYNPPISVHLYRKRRIYAQHQKE